MLQSQGFGSRKHCQQLIKNAAIEIDGQIITDPKYKLKLDALNYKVHGRALNTAKKSISP